MQKFISCDWGTSSLRVRVVACPDLSIIAERKSSRGIASIYQQWRSLGDSGADRFSYFRQILAEQINGLEQEAGNSLSGLPMVISGMAASSMGMMELPYRDLPVPVDGSGFNCKNLPASTAFNHDILLISGIKSPTDVVRGEETQLVGSCIRENEKRVFVFPGTHSKHLFVEQGKLVHCKTFMTGEFLAVLSSHTILSASLAEHDTISTSAFEAGVKESLQRNLLHGAFGVRINDLFGTFSKEENLDYLKGLLIGTELGELTDVEMVTIVAGKPLVDYYKLAAEMLDLRQLELQDADGATIRGQYRVLSFT